MIFKELDGELGSFQVKLSRRLCGELDGCGLLVLGAVGWWWVALCFRLFLIFSKGKIRICRKKRWMFCKETWMSH